MCSSSRTLTTSSKILFFFILSFPLFGAGFPADFIFGVANAPVQVEDDVWGSWVNWSDQGKVRGWKFIPSAKERLQFWTKPEVELDLARELGVQSFRMGIDWARVMLSPNQFDEKAIHGYRSLLLKARERKLKVMVTLMHHAVPTWIDEQGSWFEDQTKSQFILFSQRMIQEFDGLVDEWVTFNEPNVFVINSYVTGMWPPGIKSSPLAMFALGPLRGRGVEALDRMADAHNEIYEWVKKNHPRARVGIAHNMAHYQGEGFINTLAAWFADRVMNWRFPDRVSDHLDFYGFNYYGTEWLAGAGIQYHPDYEYSEAGRAIDVQGLYDILELVHRRYPKLTIQITENGIADQNDGIRGAYLAEHLAVIQKAIENKIPVTAYYVWTLTDNFEWSDGYCPQFGLVSVERKSMKRTPRPSYYLFQKIIRERIVSKELREREWKKVVALQSSPRPFCRAEDGVTALDLPRVKNYSKVDWRFPH